MKTIISLVLLLMGLPLMSQEGNPVNVTISPPTAGWTYRIEYSTSNAAYIGKAKSVQPTTTFTKASTNLVDVVVLTNVGTVTTLIAHGLHINNKVVFTGATVDTDLNGIYKVVTVGSSTTFTITTVNVANATYTDATLQYTTTAPLGYKPIWSIQHQEFTSNQVTDIQWADGTSGASKIWDNRATITYQ